MIYTSYNEMINEVKRYIQENLIQNDFKLTIEKTTYRNGEVKYYFNATKKEKYQI